MIIYCKAKVRKALILHTNTKSTTLAYSITPSHLCLRYPIWEQQVSSQ